jgi:hypothetical protein
MFLKVFTISTILVIEGIKLNYLYKTYIPTQIKEKVLSWYIYKVLIYIVKRLIQFPHYDYFYDWIKSFILLDIYLNVYLDY